MERVSTILHITPDAYHTAPAHLLFLPFSLFPCDLVLMDPFVSLVALRIFRGSCGTPCSVDQLYGILTIFVCRHGACVGEAPRAKYGAAKTKCISRRGELRKLFSELADQQPAAVIAACQARGEGVTTLSTRRLPAGDFAFCRVL